MTLYGEDPGSRPDIWGKVGEAGVSICTVEDVERLYAGFDLCDPSTSVSMTINGPAPMILAMFFNAAARQQARKRLIESGRLDAPAEAALQPLVDGKDWEALAPLLEDGEWDEILKTTMRVVRGTVQADILKEDQAQNTCIFSTEFALRMMGDIQQLFCDWKVNNFYSVSISGYHIAEAGANPLTQLAFTLANGFTYVETYLARGMHIDDFAHNLSFFFSNGMDPEYTVIGRVARRIWSIAIRNRYGGNERSQKLKYHIQTSGRSLHAQEIDFNDIRTTLQGLLAMADNCNSLHTNAYDEAITTPTAESVRRAVAIQLINAMEFGLLKNENPLQGSNIVGWLTDTVEEAVLDRVRTALGTRRRPRRHGVHVPTRQDPGGVPPLRAPQAQRRVPPRRRQHVHRRKRRGGGCGARADSGDSRRKERPPRPPRRLPQTARKRGGEGPHQPSARSARRRKRI